MTGGCNIIYKQNIQQGNAIEQDKLDQLKIGMTMNQVAFLLGTPAIRDPFHQQRWDYYYSISIRGNEAFTRQVTLNFENAVLKRIKGSDPDDPEGVITAETESAADTSATTAQDMSTEPESPADPEPDVDETLVIEEKPVMGSSFEETEPVQDMVSDAEESVADEPAEVVEVAIPASTRWIVQLGAFESEVNARRLAQQAGDAGFEVHVTSQEVAHIGTRYLVRTPGFDTKNTAQSQLDMINSALKIDAFLVPPGD
jgi:outer membrane protein assembly factor BamE